ncbi:MAG: hypothetical protein HYV14_18280 [Elusimicrobia bacterium]|nr:hypothetical protein [Elusimicrobiota bacterium]
MNAFRDRADDGIPRFLGPLITDMNQMKLLHSGTGPSTERLHALTFAIQASLVATPAELWSRIEPALESWLKSKGVESAGSSAYCNDFCLEAEFLYQWGERQGIVSLIITRLDENRIYLHGRACESGDEDVLQLIRTFRTG